MFTARVCSLLNAYNAVNIYVAAVRRNYISVNCRGLFETNKKVIKNVFMKMLNEDISGYLPIKD